MDMTDDFRHTTLGRTGIPVFRLGLSTTYRPGIAAFYKALDLGVNLFFGYGVDTQLIRPFRGILKSERERYALVTGVYNLRIGYPDIERTLEKRLRQFGTDYIDVFLFLGVMKGKEFPQRAFETMLRLKESGKVHAIGVSCHDREFLARLAEAGDLDVLMLRYNAAHRGAEDSVFPMVRTHNPGLISFTATRWGQLLRRPRSGPPVDRIPSAGECYRFVLSNPHIHVVLAAPGSPQQIEENIKALSHGPLSDEDMKFMREYGDRIHGQRRTLLSGH